LSVVRAASGRNQRVTAHGSVELLHTAWSRRHDPRLQWLAALAVTLVAAVAAFLHVVEDYLTGDPIVRWDVELARWLHEHSNPQLVTFFKLVTLAGNAFVLALVVLAAAIALLRSRRFGAAVLVVSVAVGIEIVNPLMKLVFQRPRPELAFVHLDTYSFPSGHAAGAAAIYFTLAALVGRRLHGWDRVLMGVGTAVLVLAIGFSRLYLGAHYLSDVLAGLALGTAWAAAWMLAFELAGSRRFAHAIPRSWRNRLA
jgi:membrane-associated phospholipid phosphatase